MRSSRAVVWFWDDPSAIYFFSSQRSSLEFLFWPVLAVPRSSRCRVWHTHPQGLVHGDISSHSQRNQVKTTPRQKQNVMKEEQNFCEYHTKQHQFCTTLDFVSVLHKINSEYSNKILQRRLGGRGEGCLFYLFILHCCCRVSSRGRWKGGGVQWGLFQSKRVFWTERECQGILTESGWMCLF